MVQLIKSETPLVTLKGAVGEDYVKSLVKRAK